MSSSSKCMGTIFSANHRFNVTKTMYKINSLTCSSRFTSSCSSGDQNKKGEPTMYEERKYGHHLPVNNVWTNFKTLKDIPKGVFRNTWDEALGWAGAAKNFPYKNPEYFSYHQMSYYDFHLHLRKYRRPF